MSADGVAVLPGHVLVYGFWGASGGGHEYVITEQDYLEILAQILRHNGLAADADAVSDLARSV